MQNHFLKDYPLTKGIEVVLALTRGYKNGILMPLQVNGYCLIGQNIKYLTSN